MRHPFDPNAWNYHQSPAEIVHTFPPALRKALGGKRKMIKLIQQGGGKALGLRVCERVASFDTRLRVPSWIMFSRAEQRDYLFHGTFPSTCEGIFRSGDPVILRSSHTEEDWMSGDAGTYLSLKSTAFGWRDILERLYGKDLPIVIQHLTPGIGITVDIGWSVLLRRVVVRIACGRACRTPEGITYTSATFDRDGEIQARDPQTGELILPVFKGLKLIPVLTDFPFDDLARTLYQAVHRTGIRFGVQMELMIHPDRPQEWNLVQIRPSPQILRGKLPIRPAMLQAPEAQTPVVNMVCIAQGRPVILTKRQDPLWQWSFRRLWYDNENLPDQELTARARGAVVLWRINVDADVGIKQVEDVSGLGAVGHLSRARLMINTTHSTFRDRERCQNPAVGILEIRTDDFDRICGLCCTLTHPRITMISDGLVGQVFVDTQDA
jgi:hypothetical protein